MTTGALQGRVVRVAGPLVEAEGLAGVPMSAVVRLGRLGIPGEVVKIRDELATVQAYEYTGGLRPGDPVHTDLRPLSVRLGPDLLGGIFDGLLRPLTAAPVWLGPGADYPRPDAGDWRFTPAAEVGDDASPGGLLGGITGAGALEHKLLVPPGVSGRIEWRADAGPVTADTRLVRVGEHELTATVTWPVRIPRPIGERLDFDEPLITGQRTLDALLPLMRGSNAAVPGGFGTGKTVLLQQIAKWCDADVIVYVGCGERGNEMADVLGELAQLDDPRSGGRLSDRTVVIANTSNMPMMAREVSIYTAVTVAEYFRDMGYHAVVIADSTSRWAEALREFASRSGALPVEEGYPADLASALAAFYERAGAVRTLAGTTGSVSILGAVSPPGGDMTEPVTSHTRRFVRATWSLDRDLAYARHYPAVSWSESFSRDTDAIGRWYTGHGDAGWSVRRTRLAEVLADCDRLSALVDLIGVTALPPRERMRLLGGRLVREAVLQQSSLSPNDGFSSPAKTAALIDMVLTILDRCESLVAAGVSPSRIEQLDFSSVVRARDSVGPDDADGVAVFTAGVLAALEGIQ